MKINLLKTAVIGGSAYYAYNKNVGTKHQVAATFGTSVATYIAYTAVQVAVDMVTDYIAFKSAEAVLKGAADTMKEELNKAEEAMTSEA